MKINKKIMLPVVLSLLCGFTISAYATTPDASALENQEQSKPVVEVKTQETAATENVVAAEKAPEDCEKSTEVREIANVIQEKTVEQSQEKAKEIAEINEKHTQALQEHKAQEVSQEVKQEASKEIAENSKPAVVDVKPASVKQEKAPKAQRKLLKAHKQ